MKILIVNAYSRSAQGQRQFAEFEDIIKQVRIAIASECVSYETFLLFYLKLLVVFLALEGLDGYGNRIFCMRQR